MADKHRTPLRLLSHHLSSGGAKTSVRNVSISHPGYDRQASGSSCAAASSSLFSAPFLAHGAAAQLYLDENNDGSASTLVIARTVEQALVLEVSILLCSHSASRHAPRVSSFYSDLPTASQRFCFPAPLLSSMTICRDPLSQRIYILALTTTGWLYRLCFSLSDSSQLNTIEEPEWVTEHRVAGIASPLDSSDNLELGGRSPTALYVAEPGLLLVACKDGTLVKLEQSRTSDRMGQYYGPIRESLLRSSSFLKSFSHFFSRSSSSLPTPVPVVISNDSKDSSAPSHVVAMTTHLREDASALGFCLTRDRKLRIWDLVTDACLRRIDLPSGIAGSSIPEELPPFAQDGPLSPLIRTFVPSPDDNNEYPLYLMLYIPAPLPSGSFFAFYGVELEETDSGALTQRRAPAPASSSSSSGLGAVALLWQRLCTAETMTLRANLRDAKLKRESSEVLNFWSLWDVDGRLLLVSTFFSLQEEDGVEQGPWTTIAYDASRLYSPLHGAQVDNAMSDDSISTEDIAENFLHRIMEAGRYSVATISWALTTYAGPTSESGLDLHEWPTASDIAAIVASGVKVQTDPSTGAVLYDQFREEVRREWMRFTGLLEEADAQSRWPLSFVASPFNTPLLILTRDRLLAADCEPLVDTASIYGSSQGDKKYLVASLNDFYVASQSHSQEGDARGDDLGLPSLEVISLANSLIKAIPEHAVTSLMTPIRAVMSAPLDRDLLETAFELYTSSIQVHDSQTLQLVRTRLQALQVARVAVILPSQTVADDVAWDKSALEAAIWALFNLVARTSEASFPNDSAHCLTSDFSLGRSLLADGLYQTLRARLSLARALFVLVLFIYVTQDDLARSFERLPLLVARLMGIVHQLSVLVQLCDSSGQTEVTNTARYNDDGAAVVAQMRSLKVGAGPAGGLGSNSSQSLIQAIISLDMLSAQHLNLADHSNRAMSERSDRSIPASIAASLASLGLSEDLRQLLSASAPIPLHTALLAHQLVLHGFPSAALQLVESYPSSAAAQYIAGEALLQLGDLVVEAANAFEAVVPALLALALPNMGSNEEDWSVHLLQTILPHSVSAVRSQDNILASYYRHISTLFESVGADTQVAVFARLALENLHQTEFHPADLPELYFRLFRSELALQGFASCYATIMNMSGVDPLLRRDCLRTLISAMCEADQVQLLLSFNFSGLQTEVERNLSFKARNCDPRAISGPKYYDILYSYHVQRGDFTSAGAVMYQQARRLTDLHRAMGLGPKGSAVFAELAIQQARSYLSAVNTLSFLAPKDAWFANAVMPGSTGVEGPEYASLQLSRYVPAHHWQPDSKELRIVRAEDVRREYQLLLARLELVQLYPELASSTMTLTASDAVALFLRNEQYDKAFATARSLRVDERGLFTSLAVKCATTAHIESECSKLAKKRRAAADPEDNESSHDAAMQKLLASIDEDYDYDSLAQVQQQLSEADIAVMSSWSFLHSSARTSSWTGSVATLAWQYLKLNLELSGPDPAYRLVVLNCLLRLSSSEGDRVPVPDWLTSWFEEARPDLLIRSYLEGGQAAKAVQCALECLKKATKSVDSVTDISTMNSVAAQQPFLSHLLLDALLQLVDKPASEIEAETRRLVEELRRELTQRRSVVLDNKWKEAKSWAGNKERQRGGIMASGGGSRAPMEWD